MSCPPDVLWPVETGVYGNADRAPGEMMASCYGRDPASRRRLYAMAETKGTCPNCKSGDLISIMITVGGRDLAFCTCHHCEAKWWFSDGEEVPLQSVIGLVVQR